MRKFLESSRKRCQRWPPWWNRKASAFQL